MSASRFRHRIDGDDSSGVVMPVELTIRGST
jgi:hypothetical protein